MWTKGWLISCWAVFSCKSPSWYQWFLLNCAAAAASDSHQLSKSNDYCEEKPDIEYFPLTTGLCRALPLLSEWIKDNWAHRVLMFNRVEVGLSSFKKTFHQILFHYNTENRLITTSTAPKNSSCLQRVRRGLWERGKSAAWHPQQPLITLLKGGAVCFSAPLCLR